MIKTKRLYEFISELVNIRNEELEEKASWEFWLHKDFERSFSEFREAMSNNSQATVSEEYRIAIVRDSNDMLSEFVPQD